MENKVEIRKIEFGTYEYKKQLDLRNKILKKTIGLNIFDEDLSVEKDHYHIGCFLYDELVGTIILTKIDEYTVRMRQVAVEEFLRGKNIGKKLIIYGEEVARSLGFKKVSLNSRKSAVSFYEKYGYRKTNEEYVENNMIYDKMEKHIEYIFFNVESNSAVWG